MKTVTVTIGRNIDDQPMNQDSWNQFGYEVMQAFESVTTETWANAVSHSQWNRVPEDSRAFYGPLRANLTALELRQLRGRLANLATRFGQQAIGMSFGESELVESYGQAEVHQPAFVS